MEILSLQLTSYCQSPLLDPLDLLSLLIVGKNSSSVSKCEALRKIAFSPDWHPRTDPTPKGVKLWASDGETVWEIWGDGKPIHEYATKVHYWAVKHMPDPPPPAEVAERQTREA